MKTSCSRPRVRFGRRAVLLSFLLAAAAAAPLGAIIVSNGPLELHEGLRVETNIGSIQDNHTLFLFPGLPQKVEGFVQFPKGVFNRRVFSSALAEDTGNIEVGIDNLGDHIDDPSSGSSTLTATSTYVAQIVNNSDDPLQIRFVFVIPGGELQVLDPQLSLAFLGAFANVDVEIEYSIGIDPPVSAFLYGLQLSESEGKFKPLPNGPVEFDDVSDSSHPELHKLTIKPFNGDVLFPDVPAHQTLLITYVMRAHGQTVAAETGFLAKLGDPLDLVGNDAARIVVVKGDLSPQALAVDRQAAGASDGNGVFEPGETARVEPAWQNAGDVSVTLTGSGVDPEGPAGPTYSTDDAVGAYGSVLPAATGSCTATDDCYTVSISDPVARPATHWDATFTETMEPGTVSKSWRVHLGDSFSDVPRSQLFYKKIETVLHHGITFGCTPTTFCPGDDVSRSQMAIFIARAITGGAALPAAGSVGGRPYDCSSGGTSLFEDVSPTDSFCKGVHFIASEAVTTGCSPAHFCPSPGVTRAEMAIFLAKAIVAPNGGAAVPETYGPDPVTGLSYSCDPASPNRHFDDVALTDSFCRHVHFLWARGDIAGCAATEYCPTANVTRDQMAKFLANAFHLQLYGP
jgi:hypothetical protein